MSAIPIPAATVILARDSGNDDDPIDVFLLRRRASLGFMPRASVFPGGRVDPDDADAELLDLVDGVGRDVAAASDDDERRLLIAHGTAAVREVLEEAGVVLATPSGDDTSRPGTAAFGANEIEPLRAAMSAGQLSFRQVCQRLGLRLRLDWLVPISRWTTPAAEPRRFDARFYLARLPAGQVASCDGVEHDIGEWLGVRAALATHATGDLRLPPPTLRTLEHLAARGTLEQALTWPWRYALNVLPRLHEDAAGRWLLLPGDPLYPAPIEDQIAGTSRFFFDGSRWISSGAAPA